MIKNEKQKKHSLILILLVIAVLAISYLVFVRFVSMKEPVNSTNKLDNSSIKKLDDDSSGPAKQVDGSPWELAIVSPEGDNFESGQARLWKAEIKNFSEETSRFGYCDWKFYLNEYDQELPYKEREARSLVQKGQSNWCGFTSTFIDKVGALRAEVTMTFKDSQGNIEKTLVAERQYLVN